MTTAYRTSAYITLLLGSTGIASAGSDLTGYFTVGGGILGYESTDESTDTNDLVLDGAASVGMRLAPAWSAQFDLMGEQVAVSHNDPDEQYQSMQAVGGHVTWRKTGTGAIGVFAGYGSATPSTEEVWSGGWLGVEGQLFFNEVTLYAQAAALDIGDHGGEGEGLDHNAFLLRGVVRYFLSDDCKIEAELATADGEGVVDDDEDDGNAREWGISIQGRLAEGPLYGTLAYRGGKYEIDEDPDQAKLAMLTVSLTYLFGTQSLKANDRDGVSLDTPTTIMRASGIYGELD